MVTSPSNTAQTFSLDDSNNHHHTRDASFSCYLNSTEENFIRKLSESTRDASFSCYLDGAEENFIRRLSKSSQSPSSNTHQYQGKSKNGKIGMFSAEKYFSGRMDDEEISKLPNLKSSSNSHNVSRNPLRRKSHVKDFFASLGFSCLDKDSVLEIDDGEISAVARSESIIEGDPGILLPAKIQDLEVFGSPVSDNNNTKIEKNLSVLSWENAPTILIEKMSDSDGAYNNETEINDGEMIHALNKARRESTVRTENCFPVPISSNIGILPEVFSSQISGSGRKLERNLSVWCWENASTTLVEKMCNSSGIYNYDNDIDSETSSDLFEIDSVSGKANLTAPSEASIDWSVATADEELIIRPSLSNTVSLNNMIIPTFKACQDSRMRRASSDDSFIRIPAGILLRQPPLAATRSLPRSSLFYIQ
ncbi:hypothetical protein ACFE04_022730 [Oxalis oulophora]